MVKLWKLLNFRAFFFLPRDIKSRGFTSVSVILLGSSVTSARTTPGWYRWDESEPIRILTVCVGLLADCSPPPSHIPAPIPAEVKRWDEVTVVLPPIAVFFCPIIVHKLKQDAQGVPGEADKGAHSFQRQAELIPHYIAQCHREGKTHCRRCDGEVAPGDCRPPHPPPPSVSPTA